MFLKFREKLLCVAFKLSRVQTKMICFNDLFLPVRVSGSNTVITEKKERYPRHFQKNSLLYIKSYTKATVILVQLKKQYHHRKLILFFTQLVQ